MVCSDQVEEKSGLCIMEPQRWNKAGKIPDDRGCEKGAARLLRREIKIFYSLCEPRLVSFVIFGPKTQPPF
jgi:hypothetical protein